jgi:hypothetical protein
MPKERKSPQEKKQLEFEKDHFTFGMHSSRTFPKVWKRKKTQANRESRRKGDKLFAPMKPEMSSEDVNLAMGDVTLKQIAKSLVGKRLRKSSTVTVGEKVRLILEKRAETVGRRVKKHQKFDLLAAEAVGTLMSLDDEQLVDFIRRAVVFLHGGDPIEWARIKQSEDRIDRALSFLESHRRGSADVHDALCRNEEILIAFRDWATKANRILGRDRRIVQRKIVQKEATEKKVKTLRRQAEARCMGK